MKIKDGFMLREVAGQWVVVPLGERVVEFNGIMSLSESAALIWRKMQEEVSEDEIIQAILEEYEVDENTAREDVREFISIISSQGLLA